MRHNTRTVDDAMVVFDWLDRMGINIVRPGDFQPAKFGGRTFGQFEALENKLSTPCVDQVLAHRDAKVIFVGGQAVVEPSERVQLATPEPLDSFFQATKVSENESEALFHVRIKRGKRTGQQLLDLTGRRHYGPSDVLATMPLIASRGEEWEEFDFLMYKPGKQTPDSKVESTRTKRGLTRDLEVQILINAAFPEFADHHSNGDSWQDADGNWCFANFYRRDGVRSVFVCRGWSDWRDDDGFGGRK
ncbi:MAG: hypothetical protein HY336_02580 [Candidatus Doudnabacteria bacterium]|nr:hypothetical protein [Candidatus Doudnabacteria bacterium]